MQAPLRLKLLAGQLLVHCPLEATRPLRHEVQLVADPEQVAQGEVQERQLLLATYCPLAQLRVQTPLTTI